MEQQAVLQKIPSVTLTAKGIFKYILIEATSKTGQKTLYVRGDESMSYHADNYELFQEQLQKQGFKVTQGKADRAFTASKGEEKIAFKCRGGGRIQHNYNGNLCFIYGYSQSFGKVDHRIAQELVSKALGYKMEDIKISQEGY